MVIHTMHFLYNCEWHKSGNLDESLWDFINDILTYEGLKLCKTFQITIIIHNSFCIVKLSLSQVNTYLRFNYHYLSNQLHLISKSKIQVWHNQNTRMMITFICGNLLVRQRDTFGKNLMFKQEFLPALCHASSDSDLTLTFLELGWIFFKKFFISKRCLESIQTA